MPHRFSRREALVTEFAWFLRTERGLAETTIDWYRHVAAMFLSAAVGDVTDMAVLSARQVNAFVLAQIGRRGTGSLNNVVTALRALLRFFYLRGYTATPLAAMARCKASPPKLVAPASTRCVSDGNRARANAWTSRGRFLRGFTVPRCST